METELNLFFSGALIGTEEAPPEMVNEVFFPSLFHAVLVKRFGNIGSADFLTYARRFAVLCDKIFRGSNLELYKNRSIKLDSSVYDGTQGEQIDTTNFTEKDFKELYDSATSIALIITPHNQKDQLCTFAKIDWTRAQPKKIFFFAQEGYPHFFNTDMYPLEHLLFKKMFFVPGSAPSLNFKVTLGVGSVVVEL